MGGVIKLFGQEFPEYIDCPWCNKKKACRFEKVTYDIPCAKCKKTEKYLQKEKESEKLRKQVSWNDIHASNDAVGVFTYKGRDLVVNGKGNIIADMKTNPSRKKLVKGADGSYK